MTQRHILMHISQPTHHSFVDHLAAQTECNSVSRRTVNVKMISVHRFQMLLIIRWILSPGILHAFPVAGAHQPFYVLLCLYTIQRMHILLSLVVLMGCFLSLPLSLLPLSIFVSLLCFLLLPPLSSSLCLCVCICGVFLSFPGR